jgi:phosphopantothenoylcysteine synthetase/decarboxylase
MQADRQGLSPTGEAVATPMSNHLTAESRHVVATTAQTNAKTALGLADDQFQLVLALIAQRQRCLCPGDNVELWTTPATQRHHRR